VALARHESILKESIRQQQGVVFSDTGDGLAAVFPRAAQALAAAVAAQRSLFAESWAEGVGPLRVRMSVHSGETEERDGNYFGTTVNRAARLMAIGHGGQVLVSGATAGLVSDRLPGEVRLRDLGEHRLRDLSVPTRVFQIVHPELRSEFPPLRTVDNVRGNLPVELTSFVGRDPELAGLSAAINESRLVTVVGVGGGSERPDWRSAPPASWQRPMRTGYGCASSPPQMTPNPCTNWLPARLRSPLGPGWICVTAWSSTWDRRRSCWCWTTAST
jgi:hypothetical protein